MEVHVRPEVQEKLDQMVRESGRPSDELVEDAILGYFDELAYTRETLDSRYDDLESGKVKLITGDEVKARLRAKSAARRAAHS
jgi:predicted transcriptional regulator